MAPQWVELALANPTNLTKIVLTVAQDPAGKSIHELWVREETALSVSSRHSTGNDGR